MKLRLALLSSLLALPVAAALAADKEVEDLLAKMRKAYSSLNSARVQVTTLLGTQMGEIELKVDTSYQKGNKINSKVSGLPEGASGISMISDGKTLVINTPEGKESQKFTVQGAETALPVNLETINLWDWARQLSTKEGGNMRTSTFKIVKKETWKNKDFMVLEETAKGQNVFVRYYIDPKTYLIHRTRSARLESRDLIMDVKVDKFTVNPKLSADLFKIKA